MFIPHFVLAQRGGPAGARRDIYVTYPASPAAAPPPAGWVASSLTDGRDAATWISPVVLCERLPCVRRGRRPPSGSFQCRLYASGGRIQSPGRVPSMG